MSKYILGHRARVRSKIIRYVICMGLLLLLAATLQVSVFSRFRIFDTVLDFMLCTVVAAAFFCGKYAGAVNGIAAGFLIEAIGSRGVSFLPLFYMLCGFLIGHYAKGVITGRYLSYLSYLAMAVAARACVTMLYVFVTYSDFRFSDVLLHILLPEAFLTMLAGSLLYFPIGFLCLFLEKGIHHTKKTF